MAPFINWLKRHLLGDDADYIPLSTERLQMWVREGRI